MYKNNPKPKSGKATKKDDGYKFPIANKSTVNKYSYEVKKK